MRKLPLLTALIFACSLNCCKKDNNATTDCLPNAETVRHINNKQATIILNNGQYHIVEQMTIDTRLIPCNLPLEFQVDNLTVTISGEVKSTPQNRLEPCCRENIFITSIRR